MKTRPNNQRFPRGFSRPWRTLVAAAVGLAGVIAVPQAAGADEPTPIVCDTDNDTPDIDCDGTTVDLSTPDYGPGLTPINPARVWDSRTANARLAAGGMVTVPVAGQVGVPTGATAVMANIAVVNPDAPGHITAYPCDATRPTTAMLTHIAGETRSGSTLVQLDDSGNLCLYSHAAADLVVDIQGYIADSQNPATFTPIRVLDTRTGEGPIDGEREFNVADMTELAAVTDLTRPEEIAGVWLNVSAVLAAAPGYVAIDTFNFTSDERTARLNYEVGRAQTNLVFAAFNNGTFTMYTSSSTDLVIDVVGVSRYPNTLVPLVYSRLLDSRTDQTTPGRLQPGVVREIDVASQTDTLGPSSVTLLNVAVVNPSGPTHITAFPCGEATPTVANANAATGTIISNAAFVPVGADGKVCVVSAAETDLVVDLAGLATVSPVGDGTCSDTMTPGQWDRITGGVPPYTLTGTLPDGVDVEYDSGRFIIFPPEGTSLTLDRELTITDAAGHQTQYIARWNGGPPVPQTC